MYIVTYTDIDWESGEQYETNRIFEKKEDALTSMKYLCNAYTVSKVRLWDAKEIKYKANVEVTIELKEE